MTETQTCIFSVDVEDWFHILDVPAAPKMSGWAGLPSYVEAHFNRLLDLFSEAGRSVTCFFVGWIAERFPHLVREAVARGHEVASHGYAHRLAYDMTQNEFRADALRSRLLLEDISGTRVVGYRAAGFSSTGAIPWFFPELVSSGYLYDSSVFPARRGHGGNPASPLRPYFVADQALMEIPASVAQFGPVRMCFFGGGYLRLFPYRIIHYMGRRLLAEGAPLMFYVHPREIDPKHPRISMSYGRRFKSYVNLHTTEHKIRQIVHDFPVTTCRDFLFRSTSESTVKKPVLSTMRATELSEKCLHPRGRVATGGAT
ncbi:MAG: polysaccharide deacetylase family protein [Acidobacteria bacterium]|nr:polysaccharide deacetylase family protein [Acidobacteriota bacterium]